MCGIAGLVDLTASTSSEDLLAAASRMAAQLRHRGPDDSGHWSDPRCGVGLGFRRLSVVDLSRAGHQPMASAGGRYVVVFNGEIYNHQELRKHLPAQSWRGHSDTEVMLAAFERWGIREATERFNGMFAFAVWDREREALTLGRDRMGEKPLYYGTDGQRVFFGSEIKAIRACPGFRASVSRDALTLFLRHGYIPAPYSIYEGIAKLLPGHLVEVSASGIGVPSPYWSAREASIGGMGKPTVASETELVDQLESLLFDAVELRMHADVPLGAFLSGGIDSSLVVALMQAQQSRPVKTFTIGFGEQGYDEAPHARSIANHLGTDHTELYVTSEEAQAVIPHLSTIYDEPFADSSQIPTSLVSQLARDQVTVSLSGDGGDELFGGYPRYLLLEELWGRLQRVPMPLRRSTASALTRVPMQRWDALFRMATPVLPGRARRAHPGRQLHRLARALRQDRPEDVYRGLVSIWNDPEAVIIDGSELLTPLSDPEAPLPTSSPALRAMQLDAVTYLPDDLLVKVDRAAMAVSLETRIPLLDHRLYEFAWSLPLDQKIRGRQGKHLLRQVLYRHVPKEMIDRPKMGFGVPIGLWLRGPLRDWADDLLAPARLKAQGLVEVGPVQQAWEAHRSGSSDEGYRVWAILMLQAWLEEHP